MATSVRHLWLDVCTWFIAQVVAFGQKLVKQQVQLLPETLRVWSQASQPFGAAEKLFFGIRRGACTPIIVAGRKEGSSIRGQSHRREHSGISTVHSCRCQQFPVSRHLRCLGSCFFHPEVLIFTGSCDVIAYASLTCPVDASSLLLLYNIYTI